jgi:hypothetical protein
MSSLHDAHEINVYRTVHVCLSVRMIQLENWWTDLDAIWYGRYVTGDYPKIVLFKFSTIGNTNMADEQTCEVLSTLAPLAIGSYNAVW